MMNKLYGSVMAVVLSAGVYSSAQAAPVAIGDGMARFTTASGDLFEDVPVSGSIDLDAMTMQINPYSMYGATLYFSSINLYGAGSYVFDVDSQMIGGGADSMPPTQLNMTVGSGQIGALGMVQWGVTKDIGVAMVWDMTYGGTVSPILMFSAADTDGDGVAGIPMVDGPFPGLIITTSFSVPVPVPAAVWLFVSGLLGLFGFVRYK